MSGTVFDASALLAWLRREPGFERVRKDLRGCRVTAVNWSETLQKSMQFGIDAELIASRFRSRGVEVVDVTRVDGERAARLWQSCPHLALADRVCLAVASRLGATVLTADRAWRDVSDVADVEIELIR